VAPKLAQDLKNGPGRLDPTPNSSLAPARQNTSADPRGPPTSSLSAEDIAVLTEFFLPSDRLIRFGDFLAAGLFTDHAHLGRAVARGFPPGCYFTEKKRVWTPRVIAAFLAGMPHEPSAVLTGLRASGGRRRAEIAASRKAEAVASGA
jgi:hypothetical protein